MRGENLMDGWAKRQKRKRGKELLWMVNRILFLKIRSKLFGWNSFASF